MTSVHANDAPVDFGPIIDDAAHACHLAPVGLLATIGSECALYSHSSRCDRNGRWPDVSFGSCQVTVSTAGGYGVGTGTDTTANREYVRRYENDVRRCVWLAARILHQYEVYTRIPYPNLNVAWNCGPGQPRWFLLHPTGDCATNFKHFLGWWDWAWSLIPRFHPAIWNHWTSTHHKPPISPYVGTQLSLAASVWLYHQSLGGVVDGGRSFPGHPGYVKVRFEHGAIYCWPATRRCTVGP